MRWIRYFVSILAFNAQDVVVNADITHLLMHHLLTFGCFLLWAKKPLINMWSESTDLILILSQLGFWLMFSTSKRSALRHPDDSAVPFKKKKKKADWSPEFCLPTAGQTSGSLKTRQNAAPANRSLPSWILPANQAAAQNLWEVQLVTERVGVGEKGSWENKRFKLVK